MLQLNAFREVFRNRPPAHVAAWALLWVPASAVAVLLAHAGVPDLVLLTGLLVATAALLAFLVRTWRHARVSRSATAPAEGSLEPVPLPSGYERGWRLVAVAGVLALVSVLMFSLGSIAWEVTDGTSVGEAFSGAVVLAVYVPFLLIVTLGFVHAAGAGLLTFASRARLEMGSKVRPSGVTALAIVAVLVSIFLAAFTVEEELSLTRIALWMLPSEVHEIVSAPLTSALALAYLLTAWGFWWLRGWAWDLGVGVAGVSVVFGIATGSVMFVAPLAVLALPYAAFQIVPGVLVLMYLGRSGVKAAFREAG